MANNQLSLDIPGKFFFYQTWSPSICRRTRCLFQLIMGHPASGPDMITATPKSRIRFFGRKSKFVNSFYKLHASLHQGQLAKSAIHRTSIERFTHVVTSTDRLLKWCDSQLPSGPHFRLGLMIYWIFILSTFQFRGLNSSLRLIT